MIGGDHGRRQRLSGSQGRADRLGDLPAGILALPAFPLPFFRGTVLEQNIARSAATVGEALAAGASFTIPASFSSRSTASASGNRFDYWQTSLILLVGGVLSVLFITLTLG